MCLLQLFLDLLEFLPVAGLLHRIRGLPVQFMNATAEILDTPEAVTYIEVQQELPVF